ncbi:alpha/beta fold hydrolase [Breoghania sp. L-A4]|uniref:alpha/beta hydrolase family protein n=1 Tax=Breoghania sp. L-A4 TaxID=2304600 RepID=UPI000E358053|nr:alpha/beta fold hydrolase [Breoghania sp. L-A4]AXS41786.1 alpha/beta fold hydrolase [Breoghania sp. L-A4]
MIKPLLAALTLLLSVSAHAADVTGFRRLALPDTERPLSVAVWYPAVSEQAPTHVAGNPVFVGVAVVHDAPASAGSHPLVVLSHGFGGNWRNQAWLAEKLVRQGYVVASANHPGTTTADMNLVRAARLWQRPRDVSRVIDALTGDRRIAGEIARNRIAVAGHSLGGWTAIELAGARFDPDLHDAECEAHPELVDCEVYKSIGAGGDAASRTALAQDLRDSRIAAAISLDLGLARAFDPPSLASIEIPVLVIAAGSPNPLLPAQLESRYLVARLPQTRTRYLEIADASHFSFLSVCKPGGVTLLEADADGDSMICRDAGGRDRRTIHRQVADRIIGFLAEALPEN